MAACAYPNCDAEAAAGSRGGYCTTCGGPTQDCRRCGTINRSLARFCRSCSAPLTYKDWIPGAYESALKHWDSPHSRLVTQERFWIAPVAYAGWLWFISVEGQLSRYSPFSGSMTPLVHLGQVYGCAAPMARVEMPAGARWTQPGLAVLSPDGVVIVGMIDGHETKITLDAGETAVADFTKEPCGIEGGDHEVSFFTRRGDRASLVIASLATGRVETRIELTECQQLAGPFRCAGQLFAYSESQLYTYSNGELKTRRFPAGFRPSMQARDPILRQAFGRLPFVVRGTAFYIPGRQANRPVFLLQKPTSGPAIIQVTGETTYGQDAYGRPVLAQDGRISVLEDSVNRVVKEDSQLTATCPAFAADDIVVGMAEPSPTSLRLRLYRSSGAADLILQRETLRESVGIYAVGNSLTFCAMLKDTTMGLYSWIC
jgi:hypothetical protein